MPKLAQPRFGGNSVLLAGTAVVSYALLTWAQQVGIIRPFAVVLTIAILDLVTGGTRAADRVVFATSLYLGLVPVFGWIRIPVWVDPIAIVSTAWIVLIVGSGGANLRRNFAHMFAVLPSGVAAFFTFQWWRGVSEGGPAVVLERLLPVWDFSSHFNFFLMNLTHGQYITRLSVSEQKFRWDGVEYPSGIHYVWSRFANWQRGDLAVHTERAIPVFANSVIVTMAITVAVMGICFMRLGNSVNRRFSYGAIGAGLAVGLVATGPLSQTVYAGFVNMTAVVIGSALILTVFARPLESQVMQTVVLAASTLALVYNWYPTALLVLPILVLHLIQLVRGRRWILLSAVGIPTAAAAAAPVLQTLTLGIKHLDLQGGVQPIQTGVLVAVMLSSVGVAVHAVRWDGLRRYLITGVPPAALLLALGLRLRMTTGQYPYYFHKASLLILSFALMSIALALIERSEQIAGIDSGGRMRSTASTLGSVLIAVALTQTFGYWGVDYPTLSGGNTAIGVLSRNELVKGSTVFLPTAKAVLREAEAARNLPLDRRSCLTLIIPTRLGVSDGTTNGPWMGTLSNVWFHALTNSYNEWSKSQAYMMGNVAPGLNNEDDLVDVISRTLDPSSICIVSTGRVNVRLRELRPDWQTRDLLGD